MGVTPRIGKLALIALESRVLAIEGDYIVRNDPLCNRGGFLAAALGLAAIAFIVAAIDDADDVMSGWCERQAVGLAKRAAGMARIADVCVSARGRGLDDGRTDANQ